MAKRAEFHQAAVRVVIRIVDDVRSYGTQALETVILMDTDAEWQSARENIDKAIAEIQGRLDGEAARDNRLCCNKHPGSPLFDGECTQCIAEGRKASSR